MTWKSRIFALTIAVGTLAALAFTSGADWLGQG